MYQITHVWQRDTSDPRRKATSCGLACLQMVTGKSFEEIDEMICWDGCKKYETNWNDIQTVFKKMRRKVGRARYIKTWEAISGVAIVRVGSPEAAMKHFMVYDARVPDAPIVHDPWYEHPKRASKRTLISYLRVNLPAAG